MDRGETEKRAGVRCLRRLKNRLQIYPVSLRESPRDDLDLFEGFFIGLYGSEGEARGELSFFDVAGSPPRARRPRPEESLSYEQVLDRIRAVYDARNNPPFEWIE